jgi:hypothetical protein
MHYCKDCIKIGIQIARRTKEGVLKRIYHDQCSSSLKRGDKPPKYTRDELVEWCCKQSIFHTLYEEWVQSGFDKNKTISCDRTNDYKRYNLKRLCITTWEKNRAKYHKDVMDKVNIKALKPVLGVHIDTQKIVAFLSIRDAQNALNISNISKVCRGKKLQSGGYHWYYIMIDKYGKQ